MNNLYVLGTALMLLPLFMNAQTDCTQHTQVSNNFENGLFNETGGAQVIANDFVVSANTTNFSASSLTANFLTQEVLISVDLKFFVDDDGAPGAEITDEAIVGLAPTSQDILGSASNVYNVREVILDFPAIDFPGNGTAPVRYWVQLSGATANTPSAEGNIVAWETTSASIIGNPLFFDNANVEIWTSSGTDDGVFSISGECTISEGCLIPENVTVSNPTSSSIDVMWTEAGSANEWVIEYGALGFSPGSGTEITDNDGIPGITLSGLEADTEYEMYIRSICALDESLDAGPVAFATTDFYCVASVITAVEAITNIEFAGISNTSDAGSTAPNEYFLDAEATVSQNGTFPITLEGFTGGDFNTSWVVFIDWNQDFEFNNEDERYEIGYIQNSTGTDGMQLTGSITVPADATLGATRMRVLKMYTGTDLFPVDACAAIGYGQSEDYTVNVDIASSAEFAEYEFKMGPNPTKDFVNISATENIERIALYNLVGQQVYASRMNVQSPIVDLSSFENGVYLMSITIKGQEHVFKIVKQ